MQAIHAAIPQQITFLVPLSRVDGKPDNSPLSTVVTLNERGFVFTSADVVELTHGKGVERTLKLRGATPNGMRSKWVPALVGAMRTLSIDEMEIVEHTATAIDVTGEASVARRVVAA
jgi:hypothetical protein